MEEIKNWLENKKIEKMIFSNSEWIVKDDVVIFGLSSDIWEELILYDYNGSVL